MTPQGLHTHTHHTHTVEACQRRSFNLTALLWMNVRLRWSLKFKNFTRLIEFDKFTLKGLNFQKQFWVLNGIRHSLEMGLFAF